VTSTRLTRDINSAKNLVAGLQFVIVLYLAAQKVMDADGFSLGMLIAFLSFRQMFSDRANNLVGQVLQFRLLGLHLERVADIVIAETEVSMDSGRIEAHSLRGEIELKNVSFAYGVNDGDVLKNVSLCISSRDFVGITGPSGGGKTTLIKLLTGQYAPTSGSIYLDGVEATPERWRMWRKQFGVVSQDDSLMSGTIFDNIAFFDAEVMPEDVFSAARAAFIDDDISRMPLGYYSLIGDMGAALSGGQRQRILLARALYRHPKVLFLDEGTANLDLETEILIADGLSSLSATRIVVAHRPALLEHAGRLFRVEAGSVSEIDRRGLCRARES